MTESSDAGADDWDAHWSDFGDSARQNPAQRLRRRLIVRHLRQVGASRIVDIGSGQGDLAEQLRESLPSIDIVGLELGASGVAQASQKVPTGRFIQTDLLQPQIPPAELARWGDAATCSEVLEHIDDPSHLLRNAMSYLRPGAAVVVTVPAGPRSEFDLFIGHRRHFSASSLREVLEGAGLVVESVESRGFPFFNLYRLVVIARGQQLVEDARNGTMTRQSFAVRALLAFFDLTFRIDLSISGLGWQLVAVARVPD